MSEERRPEEKRSGAAPAPAGEPSRQGDAASPGAAIEAGTAAEPAITDTPAAADSELQQLRRLLIEPEQDRLRAVETRLDDPQTRAHEVGMVFSDALIVQSREDRERLIVSMSESVTTVLERSVQSDPRQLANALFPVMGPAIRRSIVETVRSMIESTNRVLEQSLSWQGLRWRLEAWRTGRPFAEVALLHSLVYRVEQLLLIHKETGLSLHHLVAPEVQSQDPEMVSGMLTAIRDFVQDSFGSGADEALDEFRVGELKVLVEDSPHAALAAVVRGNAPAALRTRLQEALEAIEARFGDRLAAFDGDSEGLQGIGDELKPALRSHYQEEAEQRGRRWVPRLLLVAVLLAVASWIGYRALEASRWRRARAALEGSAGIHITRFERRNGRYEARGLRDPLAADPRQIIAASGRDPGKVSWQLEPYISLDEGLQRRRLEIALAPPPSTDLELRDGVLYLRGRATAEWLARSRSRAALFPGVERVDATGLEVGFDAETLALAEHIEATSLPMQVNSIELVADSEALLQGLQRDALALLEAVGADKVRFLVRGHTDRSGSEARNRELSADRALRIRDALITAGLPESTIEATGLGTQDYVAGPTPQEEAARNRRVSLRVLLGGEPTAREDSP